MSRKFSKTSGSVRPASIKAMGVTAAVVGLGLGLGVPAAGAAVARPAKAPAWHSVGPARVSGSVTALTAASHAGKTYEWAFVTPGNAITKGLPSVYARTGNGSWVRSSIPGSKAGESFFAATALSPTEVLAFSRLSGSGSRVWLYNGRHWSVIKTFSGEIGSASVLAANDVWVFGGGSFGSGNVGVWHFNGHAWTQLSRTLQGGSATSATSAWAFSGKTVAHYNGKKWTFTSLARLLPARNGYGGSHLTSMFASAANDVYAVGTGGSEHNGGPGAVVLQYNGHAWAKVASYSGLTPLSLISGDGHGGVWFPMYIAASSSLLHYVNGSHRVTATALPRVDEIESLATIGGSTQELAGGFAYNTASNAAPFARIDLYS